MGKEELLVFQSIAKGLESTLDAIYIHGVG
jgi:hypothetical protein